MQTALRQRSLSKTLCPAPHRPRPTKLRAGLRVVLLVIAFLGPAAALAALWWVNATMATEADSRVYADLAGVPPRVSCIVLGMKVMEDGRPTRVLEDRLETARALFVAGKVQRILVSGNGRSPFYDEALGMKRWLVAKGVPERVIDTDREGFRTRDTMERAQRVFGLQGAIVVTQRFHLPRAVYIGRWLGMDVVGLVADRRSYPKLRLYRLREFFARGLTKWELPPRRGAHR